MSSHYSVSRSPYHSIQSIMLGIINNDMLTIDTLSYLFKALPLISEQFSILSVIITQGCVVAQLLHMFANSISC